MIADALWQALATAAVFAFERSHRLPLAPASRRTEIGRFTIMSKQAQRYQPTKRQAVRVALTSRELATEVARYQRSGVVR
jgi:hypothetical protein